MNSELPASSDRKDREKILSPFRMALLGVALASGILNVLMLTGSFYMLEIYDRVVPSHTNLFRRQSICGWKCAASCTCSIAAFGRQCKRRQAERNEAIHPHHQYDVSVRLGS